MQAYRAAIEDYCFASGVTRIDFARTLWDLPNAQAALQRLAPLGRIGEPDEITDAAVFLASKAGAYVTGQVSSSRAARPVSTRSAAWSVRLIGAGS
jgi:NAD(P)-dependent dehydrogenase (short-subunit alcohol dehydrogenase family)